MASALRDRNGRDDAAALRVGCSRPHELLYSDSFVSLYLGDFLSDNIAALDTLEPDLVIADPPYGTTKLAWDRWLNDWPMYVTGRSMWCFGSLRMFMEHAQDFANANWQQSHDIVWEKHNGSSFQADRFRRVHEHAVHFYRGAWSKVSGPTIRRWRLREDGPFEAAPNTNGRDQTRRLPYHRRRPSDGHERVAGELRARERDSSDPEARSASRATHPLRLPAGRPRTRSVRRLRLDADRGARARSTRNRDRVKQRLCVRRGRVAANRREATEPLPRRRRMKEITA